MPTSTLAELLAASWLLPRAKGVEAGPASTLLALLQVQLLLRSVLPRLKAVPLLAWCRSGRLSARSMCACSWGALLGAEGLLLLALSLPVLVLG